MHDQHDKDHKLLVLSIRFPINDVPKETKILRPVLVSTVQTKVLEPDIYDMHAHLCANGSDQTANLEGSYSPA